MKDTNFDIKIKLGEIDIELPQTKEEKLQLYLKQLVFGDESDEKESEEDKPKRKYKKRMRKRVSSGKKWTESEDNIIKDHLHELGSGHGDQLRFARRMAGMLPKRSVKATVSRVRILLRQAKKEARENKVSVQDLLNQN